METKAIVKIIFKDGDVGYFKDNSVITSKREEALIMEISYARGLVRGLNFAIETYQDSETDHAEIMEVL